MLSTKLGKYLHHQIATIASTKSCEEITVATEVGRHADSPVVGPYATILEVINKTVQIYGFTTEIGKPIRILVVMVVVAYDCDITNNTYILVLYNAIYILRVWKTILFLVILSLIL